MTLRVDSNTQIDGAQGAGHGEGATPVTGGAALSVDVQSEGGLVALPEPLITLASGGDLIAELTALLTLASRSDRDAARKAERAEDMLRTQEEHLKVQHLHEQADNIRAQGWAEGLSEIGQGFCQIGAGTFECVPGKLDWNDVSLAMNKGFAAAGSTVTAQFKAMEKLDQADAEEAGGNADRAGRGAKEASEDVENARGMLKKIASFYEQMLQAQSASMNAAANWRA